MWSDAGFTGAVTFQPGNGNYVIGTEDRTAGRAYPCDSTVTVGPEASIDVGLPADPRSVTDRL